MIDFSCFSFFCTYIFVDPKMQSFLNLVARIGYDNNVKHPKDRFLHPACVILIEKLRYVILKYENVWEVGLTSLDFCQFPLSEAMRQTSPLVLCAAWGKPAMHR